MVIELFMYTASPPCAFVRLVARRIGLPLLERELSIPNRDVFKEPFVKMNPQCSVPLINDNGFLLAESRAIGMYLVNKYAPESPLYPREPQRRAVVDWLLFFELGTVYNSGLATMRKLAKDGTTTKGQVKRLNGALGAAVRLIGQKPFLASDELTLPDIGLALTIGVILKGYVGGGVKHLEDLKKYHLRVRQDLPEYDEYFEEMISAMPDYSTKLKK